MLILGVKSMDDFKSLLDALDREEAKQYSSPQSSVKKVKQDALDAGMQNIDTYMDIVFCIDVTQSMQPTINKVKGFTLSLYDSLVPFMLEKAHREVKQMRAKVIAFRDFYCDGSCSLIESEFFKLPEQNSSFKSFVNSLQAKGGGDDPENALEALAIAMRTDWVKINDLNTQRARHVIVLFTDDAAHKFEQAQEGTDQYYPKDMLRSYEELIRAWQGQSALGDNRNIYAMDKRAKRLVVFAPDDLYPWNEMSEDLENAVFLPMEKGGGGIDIANEVIINTIGGTI